MNDHRLVAVLGVALAILLVISGIAPYERSTWMMEVAPIFIAVPVMAYSYRRFPLTRLLYVLIFLHAVILLTGGAYTYARVPLGDWMQRVLGTTRNPYDKIGHFAQGFVPSLVARELFIRGGYVRGRKMTTFLCGCVAMAISACYELVEWGAALALGQGADEFLGTQGYVWDTQSDMWYALLGATTALLLFSRWHDREIARLARPTR
jgi:putative membrane protein